MLPLIHSLHESRRAKFVASGRHIHDHTALANSKVNPKRMILLMFRGPRLTESRNRGLFHAILRRGSAMRVAIPAAAAALLIGVPALAAPTNLPGWQSTIKYSTT